MLYRFMYRARSRCSTYKAYPHRLSCRLRRDTSVSFFQRVEMSLSALTAEVEALPSDAPQSQKQPSSKFLVLSPTQSVSFEQSSPPSKPTANESVPTAAFQAAAAEAITALSSSPADNSTAAHEARRSSSVSTANSEVMEKKRFLRLGPVLSGGDVSDAAVVEED